MGSARNLVKIWKHVECSQYKTFCKLSHRNNRMTGSGSIWLSCPFWNRTSLKSINHCMCLQKLCLRRSSDRTSFLHFRVGTVSKGQLISKCPFGVIVSTKIPTKFLSKYFLNFWFNLFFRHWGSNPKKDSLVFWPKRWRQKDISKFADL